MATPTGFQFPNPFGTVTSLDATQPYQALAPTNFLGRAFTSINRSMQTGMIAGETPWNPGDEEYYQFFMRHLQETAPRATTMNSLVLGNILPPGYRQDTYSIDPTGDIFAQVSALILNVMSDVTLVAEWAFLITEEPQAMHLYLNPGGEVMWTGVWHRQDQKDPTVDIVFTSYFYLSLVPDPATSITGGPRPKVNPKTDSDPMRKHNPYNQIGFGFILQQDRIKRIPDTPQPPPVVDHPPPAPPPPQPPPPVTWPSTPDAPGPPQDHWHSDLGYFVSLSDVKYYDEEPPIRDSLIYEFDYEDHPFGFLSLGPDDEWESDEIVGEVIRGIDVGIYGQHRLSYASNGDFTL